MREFFKTLFKDGEGVCTGSAYATEVSNYAGEGEFFCVNPLDLYVDHAAFMKEEYSEHVARRADLNVSSYRNFIFEMDSMPLEDQLNIFRNSAIPFTSIVYSGSKSYHAILAVEENVVGEAHRRESIEEYKKIWRRLEAKLNLEAKKAGFVYPDGRGSFLDGSCKNPSRLTRYPEVVRDNGNNQELLMLGETVSKEEFLTLLSECPTIISFKKDDYIVPEDEVTSMRQFEDLCPRGLLRKLKIVDWGASEGMYPVLRDYTAWAVDSTNVSRETFVEFLEKYTFKSLIRCGYPGHKLMAGVDAGFKLVGR